MASRHRVEDVRSGHIGSYYHVSFDPQTGFRSVADGTIRTCDDTHGELYHANDFVLDERETYWIRLNGEWIDSGNLIVGCYDMPCSHMAPEAPSPLSDRYGLLDHLELSDLAWKVLANTNPSRPEFSMPTQLGELWELPSIVKGMGGSLLQKVAAGHLSWRWAVKPMLSDFQKMMKFQQLVYDRMRELRQLEKGKKLRKRCHLGKDEHDAGWGWIDYPFESTVVPVWGVDRTTYRMRMWGTVSYRLDPSWKFPSIFSDSSDGSKRHFSKFHRMEKYAEMLCAGVTSYETLATAWELLPWSWLVDWFFGIGEVIAACNNTVPVTWGSICVMRTSSAMKEFKVTRIPEWCTATVPRPSLRIVKERYVATPVLPFSVSFPLFDGGKWSVLLSLAALAFGPGRK
jgi:hypothetical protein